MRQGKTLENNKVQFQNIMFQMPYRRQGPFADEPLADLGADYEEGGSGDDYWHDQVFQNFNINNGRK